MKTIVAPPSECNLNLSKTTKPVDSADQLKYPRSAAYSAKHCLLNKQQMWGAAASVHGVICKKHRNVRNVSWNGVYYVVTKRGKYWK